MIEIPRRADYALRTLVELAMAQSECEGPNEPVSASTLSQCTDVPYAFLTKILAELSRHKLVSISKGSRGGAVLSVDPTKTTALEVIEIVAGPLALNRCVIEPDGCTRSTVCSAHNMWVEAREGLEKALSKTLKELADTQAERVRHTTDDAKSQAVKVTA